MAYLAYVYIMAAFLVASSYQTQMLPCNGKPTPTAIEISGCTNIPCNFKRGSDIVGDIHYIVPKSTKTLKPVVDVQLGEVHMKYPLPQQNACLGLVNAECPLDKGERVTYRLKMPIEKFYPKVSMTIQLELVDDSNQTQMCLKMPAKVVD